MPPVFKPAHEFLTFMAPLSEERAGRLVQFLSGIERGTVVDFGCGWAELLSRVLESAPGVMGQGFDLNGESISAGTQLGEKRGVGGRMDLRNEDAKGGVNGQVDGVICIGASHIWGDQSETPGPMDYGRALTAIREILRPGGRVVYAEGIWDSEPTQAAIQPLSGRRDEFVFLPELVQIAQQCGFRVVSAEPATLAEWDEFEYGFRKRFEDWLETHNEQDPDWNEVTNRLAIQKAAYEDGYRGILGFGYLQLIAE